METGGLSPAAWTRVTVKAAETMRYEVATRPPESRTPPNNNATQRVGDTNQVRFDPGAIAFSAAEQTQTVQAVARRKQANLKSLPKEGEDDELPGSRGRRGASARSARFFTMDAEGNLAAFGGDGGEPSLGEGDSEDPLFQSPGQRAAEAGEDAELGLHGSSSLAGVSGADEWQSHLLTPEQKERTQAMRTGRVPGTVAMDDPALLVQGGLGPASDSPRGEIPTLFPPARNTADPYFVPPQIGSESLFHPDEEERASLYEVPDGQSIFQPEERESIYDIGEVEPIFDVSGEVQGEAMAKDEAAALVQVEKEVMLDVGNQPVAPARRLDPALRASLASTRYR